MITERAEWPTADWIDKLIDVNCAVVEMHPDVVLRDSDQFIECFNLSIEWWMEWTSMGQAGEL